jgi:hypothetical protein
MWVSFFRSFGAWSKRAMLRGPLFQAQDSKEKDRATEQKTAEKKVKIE